MLDGADFCEKCGGKLDPEDDICPSCGARAGGLEHEHKKKEDKEKLREFLAEDTETPILEEVEKRNPLLSFVIVLIGILLIIAMIAGIWQQKKAPSRTYALVSEDLAKSIAGSWRIIEDDGGNRNTLHFFQNGTYQMIDEKSNIKIDGAYRFPQMNEIVMAPAGRPPFTLNITMYRGELIFLDHQKRAVMRCKRTGPAPSGTVSSNTPAPSSSAGPNALLGRWKVIKVEIKGGKEEQKKHWERVTVDLSRDGEGRMVWQNLDQASGLPPAAPAGSARITTYLELEDKKGSQRDGNIITIMDNGSPEGPRRGQVPVRTILEQNGVNLTMQMIWPGDILITLYTQRE